MISKLFGAVAVGMAALIFLLCLTPASAQSPTSPSDTLLVRLQAGLAPSELEQLLAAHGLYQAGYDADLDVYRVKATPSSTFQKAQESLARDSRVRWVERNASVHATGFRRDPFPKLLDPASKPGDPMLNQEWGLFRVQAPRAWALVQGGTNSLTLALIDTGADLQHPDLKPRLVRGFNFVDPGAPPDDDYWHGTAVAGVAGAVQNNDIGIAGTALRVKLMPLKILDANGNGTLEDLARAIRYAAAHKARVVNMSLATSPDPSMTSCPRVIQEQIDLADARGLLLVASAGNAGSNTPVFPAACAHVFSVASTGRSDTLSWFSNWGNWVDVAAPGEDILSTLPGGDYGYSSGTSFSSPFVAGTAALLWQRRPGLSPLQVERVIELAADRNGATGPNNILGWGRLNAAQAVVGKR